MDEYQKVWIQNPSGLVFVQPESGAYIDLSNFRNRVYYPALKKAGRRNEPAHLTFVLETIAQLRDISKEQLAEQLHQTTTAFFKL